MNRESKVTILLQRHLPRPHIVGYDLDKRSIIYLGDVQRRHATRDFADEELSAIGVRVFIMLTGSQREPARPVCNDRPADLGSLTGGDPWRRDWQAGLPVIPGKGWLGISPSS